MSDQAVVDVCRVIYDGNEGASVVVQPAEDNEFVGLATSKNKTSEEWYGKFDVSFSPKVARAVAASLIACADEIENSESK